MSQGNSKSLLLRGYVVLVFIFVFQRFMGLHCVSALSE